MISDLIVGFVIFCFEMMLGLIRGVIALVEHVFGWPVIIAAIVIAGVLWHLGLI